MCGAEVKKVIQESVATGNGNTSVKACIVKRSTQVNRPWFYRFRLSPGKWTPIKSIHMSHQEREFCHLFLSLEHEGFAMWLNAKELDWEPAFSIPGCAHDILQITRCASLWCRQTGQQCCPELGPAQPWDPQQGTSLIDEHCRVN